MVKKRLANGDPCEKCAQTEDMLRRRGLWGRIDEVVWAQEGDDRSPGALLGRKHGIKVAPFFVLDFDDGTEAVYSSPLRLIRDHFPEAPQPVTALEPVRVDNAELAVELKAELEKEASGAEPAAIVRLALERFGERCAVVLTGAEDVVLVDLASKTRLPFRVVFVDSGRLHTETYSLIDNVQRHYGIEIMSAMPDSAKLATLINEKGQNSFLRDGHHECCAIRRFEPLARALAGFDAFMALHEMGRELQSAGHHGDRDAIEIDTFYSDGRSSDPPDSKLRFNPLVNWDANAIWSYVRKQSVPHNELHVQGYRTIGCQPCTRAVRRDQDATDGLWWWEHEQVEHASSETSGDGI